MGTMAMMGRASALLDRHRKAGAFGERELTIPADLGMLSRAREWAVAAAADFGFDEEERFEVRLATSEAVTNAIVHGSGGEGGVVELEACAKPGALIFEVRDEGPVARGTRAGDAPPRSLGEGGRGLELVALVMDEVELERRGDGSVLRFAKRRAA